MRIFVTAGNTQVSIDRVRCITNIFTGRTGAAIALEAYRRGHQVTLVTSHPEGIDEVNPDPARWHCLPYRTFDDLDAIMAEHIGARGQHAIVHSAAVSDYLVEGIYAPAIGGEFDPGDKKWHGNRHMVDCSAGKVKSDQPELWLHLVRAPKLIDKIRGEWNYGGLLAKFKLEVSLSNDELLAIAEKSRQQSKADWMVANTLEGASKWALLGNAGGYMKVARAELPAVLLDVLERQHAEAQHG